MHVSGGPAPCKLHSFADKVALMDSKDDHVEMPNSEIFTTKMLVCAHLESHAACFSTYKGVGILRSNVAG